MPPESCQGYFRSKPVRLTRSRLLGDAPVALGLVEAHDLERQRDVPLDRAPGIERRRLEDIAIGALLARLLGRHAVDRDRAGGRLLEIGDDAQKRGLAAAGRADEARRTRRGSMVEVDVRTAPRPARHWSGRSGEGLDVDDDGLIAAATRPAEGLAHCAIAAMLDPDGSASPDATAPRTPRPPVTSSSCAVPADRRSALRILERVAVGATVTQPFRITPPSACSPERSTLRGAVSAFHDDSAWLTGWFGWRARRTGRGRPRP